MVRRQLARAEPYVNEAILAACAIWCSKCLYRHPSNMTGLFGPYYRVMLALDGHEQQWATLSGLAGALLVLGLLLSRWHLALSISVPARIVGLGLAGFFFVVLGVSWLSANTDSLAAFPMVVLGLSGWAILLRAPAIPGWQMDNRSTGRGSNTP